MDMVEYGILMRGWRSGFCGGEKKFSFVSARENIELEYLVKEHNFCLNNPTRPLVASRCEHVVRTRPQWEKRMNAVNPVSVYPAYAVRTKVPSDTTWKTVGYAFPKSFEEGCFSLDLRHPITSGMEVALVPVSQQTLVSYPIDD